jgi:hypothetical protein
MASPSLPSCQETRFGKYPALDIDITEIAREWNPLTVLIRADEIDINRRGFIHFGN